MVALIAEMRSPPQSNEHQTSSSPHTHASARAALSHLGGVRWRYTHHALHLLALESLELKFLMGGSHRRGGAD